MTTAKRSLPVFLSVLVGVPLLLSSITASGQTFIDVPSGVWFSSYVAAAVELGIVSGYTDQYGNSTGRFGPQNTVTIAEALKIALESAGYDKNMGVGYGHWAAQYLSIAVGEHFAVTQNGQINLDRPASRAEVASLIRDAFHVPLTNGSSSFSDVSYGEAYAQSIITLYNDGIISGDTDSSGGQTGRFRPRDSINRAETVKIAINAHDKYGEPGSSGGDGWWWYSSSSSSRRSSSSSSYGFCEPWQCGTAPGMPNYLCQDGSTGGPVCQRFSNGACGWVIKSCPRSSSSSSSHSAVTFDVRYTNQGFEPSVISIRAGDIVRFKNESGIGMWVASNPHPTHTDYAELDAHGATASGATFSFTFSRIGTWGYHNHLKQSSQAVVIVNE
jgi:plastocyanin